MAERIIRHEDRMTEKAARTVLQAVVSTPESLLSLETSLDAVVGYSITQIRRAVYTVGRRMLRGQEMTERHDPNVPGVLSFWINQAGTRLAKMELSGEELLVEMDFPLAQGDSPFEASGLHFIDTTSEKGVTLNNFGQPLTLDTMRHLYRGTRWLAANMLTSRRIILPNQLDSLLLEGKNPKLLPAPPSSSAKQI